MSETFNSYYFSLESTGNKEVDTILSSVAFAGSMCHDTIDWTEDDHGGSVVDGIQEAANLAAKTINTQVCDYAHEIDDLKAQVKELKEKLSLYEWRDIKDAPKDGTWFFALWDGVTRIASYHVQPPSSVSSEGWESFVFHDELPRPRKEDPEKFMLFPLPPTQEGEE